MEKISLYIAGKKVDLDNNSFILFNYTMEDLSNPTIVKNSFSKQITLKGTPANNEVFGNLYRADRRTIFGDGYTGVAFDPLRKTPFTIYNEMNEIIESGYVKVDSVDKVSGGYEYKITLYGGLGSFFYGLTYDSDGNKRTLADLRYVHHDGTIKQIESKQVDKQNLLDAWTCLKEGSSYFETNPSASWDIVNFAPCYNGIPKDFDANKLLVDQYTFSKIGSSYDVGGYYRKSDCETTLCVFTNPHTEWETRCLRPYLQRMVISVRSILEAICEKVNNGGYIVEIEDKIKETPMFLHGWFTLSDISQENRNSAQAIYSVLNSSLTPCDYILGIAKMYGLVFLYEAQNKKVRILSRDTFYSNANIIDITNRIDASNININPVMTDSKWYQLGFKSVGKYAESYKETYGVDYGVQKINTGYEFNSEIKEITKGMPFISAADIVERSPLYAYYYTTMGALLGDKVFPISIFEYLERQLFQEGTGQSGNYPVSAQYDMMKYYDDSIPYYDLLPKVQFCDKDNKPVDGANCLLFFNGIVNIPSVNAERFPYYVSDDHPDMETLNGGKQCWIINTSSASKNTSYQLFWLPSFRRMLLSGDTKPYQVVEDANWGMALEKAVIDIEQDTNDPKTLYSKKWKAYLTDRYDVDAKVMKCKVNLSGMQVGQQLMRHFFFYENAIWVLNKISNHSITTDDLTECEFVKVKDIKNYTEGQKL